MDVATFEGLYISAFNAHVQDHVSGMPTTRHDRGMSALDIRPAHLLAHPIGGRYGLPRVFEQGRKGDRSEFWKACDFGYAVESLFTPVAAEAPHRSEQKDI